MEHLLVLFLIFCLVGAIVWVIVGLLPLPPVAKQVALAVLGIIFLIWLLEAVLPGAGVGLR